MIMPDWPPIKKPMPMNSAVIAASRMAVRK
jgi:hypothetical protein